MNRQRLLSCWIFTRYVNSATLFRVLGIDFERQVSFSLRNCTERSLLVIDEFGKGTESQDGAGLFAGLCHALIRRGRSCPKAILATHYQHIFFMKDLVESRPLALAHMALVKTGSALHQNDYDFAFTFKYAYLGQVHKSTADSDNQASRGTAERLFGLRMRFKARYKPPCNCKSSCNHQCLLVW